MTTRLHADCPVTVHGWTETLHTQTGHSDASTVALTDDGGVIIGGHYAGTVDLDPTAGVLLSTSAGYIDPYVTRLSADGSHVWTVTYGGNSTDSVADLVIDSANNVLLFGSFESTTIDLDPGPGQDIHALVGDTHDAYLTKLSADGEFIWGRTIAGPGYIAPVEMTLAPSGDIFLVGFFDGTLDFDPTAGVDEHTSISGTGGYDVFVTKLTADADYVWTRTFAAPVETAYGYGVAVDSQGNAYVLGAFTGRQDFDPGPGVDMHTSNGNFDGFVVKSDSDGSFIWARTFGGPDYDMDYGGDIALDPAGDVIVTSGFRQMVDFDPTAGVDERTAIGDQDLFMLKLHSDGSYGGAQTIGGVGALVDPQAIRIDTDGNRFITGGFRSAVDFDPGPGVDLRTPQGDFDMFLAQFGPSGEYRWTITLGSNSFYDWGRRLALDESGSNVYLVGYFGGPIDFDFGPGTDIHVPGGNLDGFITRIRCGPTSDLDSDGDVDLTDFGLLAGCLTGPDVPPATSCASADQDADGDLDLRDVAIFESAFTG
jgi:hypothetical protein